MEKPAKLHQHSELKIYEHVQLFDAENDLRWSLAPYYNRKNKHKSKV